jgi:DNA gyrase/topoisomerase IV subunit A
LDRLGVCFRHELDAAECRLEIVRGYLKAINKIDLVIKIIRAAASPKEALIELVSNRSLKFSSEQARAILEMKLRALTNLDSEELVAEEDSLKDRIAELEILINDGKARKAYMIKEIKAIGVRHGEKRRSDVIDPPESLAIEKGSNRVAAPVTKPRFLKIDMKRGVVEHAKGPRGAIILERTDKLVTLTEDGILKKVPSHFKGALGESFSPVLLAKKETDVQERKFLVVFTLGDQVKAMSIAGDDLTKVTSKGKHLIPEGAILLFFGEGSYTIPWTSSRKKKVELSAMKTKQGKPGAKGIKVAMVSEVTL